MVSRSRQCTVSGHVRMRQLCADRVIKGSGILGRLVTSVHSKCRVVRASGRSGSSVHFTLSLLLPTMHMSTLAYAQLINPVLWFVICDLWLGLPTSSHLPYRVATSLISGTLRQVATVQLSWMMFWHAYEYIEFCNNQKRLLLIA